MAEELPPAVKDSLLKVFTVLDRDGTMFAHKGGVIPTNWRMASSLVSHWALAAARSTALYSAVQPQYVRGGGLGE